MSDALEDLKVIGLHTHTMSKALNRAIREIERLRAREATVREEALEEAVKIADEYECHLMDYGGSVDAQHFYEGGMLDAGQGIAAAIRALSESSPNLLPEQTANIGKEAE